MKRFITLLSFTEHGRRDIADSPARAQAFTEMAAAAGAKINALYWTVGGYDGIISFDAPDEETATALMLKLTSAGNVTTHTLRAFARDEMERVLSKAESL